MWEPSFVDMKRSVKKDYEWWSTYPEFTDCPTILWQNHSDICSVKLEDSFSYSWKSWKTNTILDGKFRKSSYDVYKMEIQTWSQTACPTKCIHSYIIYIFKSYGLEFSKLYGIFCVLCLHQLDLVDEQNSNKKIKVYI